MRTIQLKHTYTVHFLTQSKPPIIDQPPNCWALINEGKPTNTGQSPTSLSLTIYQPKEQFYWLRTTNQKFFNWKFYVIFSHSYYSVFYVCFNLVYVIYTTVKTFQRDKCCNFLITCDILFILLHILLLIYLIFI